MPFYCFDPLHNPRKYLDILSVKVDFVYFDSIFFIKINSKSTIKAMMDEMFEPKGKAKQYQAQLHFIYNFNVNQYKSQI